MIAAVNDLSFVKSFSSKQEAIQKVHQWMDICRKIESKETTEVKKLYSTVINTSMEIAPGYPLIQLVKEFQTQDEKRYLMHLLANLDQPKNILDEEFKLGNSCSVICAWAKDDFLISLESEPVFAQSVIEGMIGRENTSIKNISRQEHIQFYKIMLGIRCYEPNKKHRKDPYVDGAGRYVDAMDLNDEEAQELLNCAIEINGNLYGKKHGRYYCFQRHHENCYHGYQNNELGLHIINKIDKYEWE